MATSVPGAAALAAYDAWHARLDVDVDTDTPWHRMVKGRLRPDQDLAGRRILEVACGRGGFAVWLARHPSAPREVIGSDFSPTALTKAAEFAATQGLTGVRWQVADIQLLCPFADGEFDTVISTETIEHVPDPPRAVRQLARVLRPGGRLFLTTPNYLNSMGLYRVYCRLRGKKYDEGGQPICHFTTIPKTRRWVRQAGLRVVETISCGHYLPFPGRPPISLRFLERPWFLLKWFGVQSLIVAEKPGPAPAGLEKEFGPG
jgi:2-polyprenyl-3-methyl-5-hydroxy-6-metoxy-1,4-benzoquinol methylase